MIALLPAVLTLASPLVAVPGLHVETTGTGPVVVLVHAFHMDLRQWDEQMPALGGYRVVRYDVRGHGKSGPPGDGYAARAPCRDERDRSHGAIERPAEFNRVLVDFLRER